MSIEDV